MDRRPLQIYVGLGDSGFFFFPSLFPNSHQYALGSPGYVPGARQGKADLNMTRSNPGLLTNDLNLHQKFATLVVSVWIEHI